MDELEPDTSVWPLLWSIAAGLAIDFGAVVAVLVCLGRI